MFIVPDARCPLSNVRSRVPAANSQEPIANSPRARKAQVSMEYLMLAGVVMMLVLAGSYFFFSNAQSSSSEVKDAQIQKLGNDVVNAVRNVYYQGNPTKVTIRGTLPDNVVGIDVVNTFDNSVNQLVFYERKGSGISQVVFSSDVRLSGSISPNAGLRKVLVSAQNDGNGVPYVYLSSGSCGDGVCAADESCQSCFEDCRPCVGCSVGSGVCVNSTRSYVRYCVGSGIARSFGCVSGACKPTDASCPNGCVGGACV